MVVQLEAVVRVGDSEKKRISEVKQFVRFKMLSKRINKIYISIRSNIHKQRLFHNEGFKARTIIATLDRDPNQVSRQLKPEDFYDAKAIYQYKSTLDLLQSSVSLQLCSFNFLVDHSLQARFFVISFQRPIIHKHFCFR